MTIKRKLHLLVVISMLAAILAACGDPTATTAPASTTAAAATTTAAATTAAGATTTAAAATTTAAGATTTAAAATTTAAGATTTAAAAASGIFRDAQASEPKTLDPGFVTDNVSIRYGQNIFEGLVELNPKLEVVPAAAEALPTVSADGLTYTYKLKKGLKWSNGDPLTVDDFIYAWNRVAQLGDLAQYSIVMYDIKGFEAVSTEKDQAKREAATVEGIKKVDDSTISITLDAAKSYFLLESALWTYWPVNQKVVESKGKKFDEKNPWSTEAANLVSNGPFVLKEWKHDQSMKFEPNPNYTGTAKVAISGVTVDIIKENATQKIKYDNNELDDIVLPVADVQKASKDAKYKDAYKATPQARITWVGFNYAKDNLLSKNALLRKALAQAIDRQQVTDGALQGAALPATILIPQGFLGYKDVDTLSFSVDKAKATLKEAGYDTADKIKALGDEINNYGGGKSGGFAFNADSDINKAWAESLQQQWKANLGLDIKLNPIATFKEFLKRRDEDKEFLMYRGSWGADFPDPQNFYEQLFSSKSGNNASKLADANYDAAVVKGNTGTTPAARAESYQVAEKILQDNAYYVPLFTGVEVRLVRPTLVGYGYNAQSPFQWKYITSIKK